MFKVDELHHLIAETSTRDKDVDQVSASGENAQESKSTNETESSKINRTYGAEYKIEETIVESPQNKSQRTTKGSCHTQPQLNAASNE